MIDIYERLKAAFDETKEGSLLDRKLVRKGEIELSDLHETLKKLLAFKGEITEADLNKYFREMLKLSGEIDFTDFTQETQKILAVKGKIDFEDLNKALQNRFKFLNITEEQLSPGLLDKINSVYHKESLIIDCGDFETFEPNEIIDGGDW